MFPLLINPLSILLTITTSLGVLVHDTQIDRATSTALALPIAFATFGAAEATIKFSDPHLHAERVSFSQNLEQLRSSQPRLQIRTDEDNDYVSIKKHTTNGLGSEYNWPLA